MGRNRRHFRSGKADAWAIQHDRPVFNVRPESGARFSRLWNAAPLDEFSFVVEDGEVWIDHAS